MRQGSVWNKSGFAKYRYKNKNLPEGHVLSIKACVGHWHGGRYDIFLEGCSGWKSGST